MLWVLPWTPAWVAKRKAVPFPGVNTGGGVSLQAWGGQPSSCSLVLCSYPCALQAPSPSPCLPPLLVLSSLFLIYTGSFFSCILTWQKLKKNKEEKGRALFFLEGLHPHKLIASQRPHLPVPSHWMLAFQHSLRLGGNTKMHAISTVAYATYRQWDLVRLFMIRCM